jgi:Tim44-like domain
VATAGLGAALLAGLVGFAGAVFIAFAMGASSIVARSYHEATGTAREAAAIEIPALQCQMSSMSFLHDPLNLVIAVILVIACFRLWQVLGQRTGTGRAPPPTTFSTQPLPTDLELKAVEPPARKIWEGYAPEGSALARSLAAIASVDSTYDSAAFLEGAKSAHERILNAFAEGDLATLRYLLDDETFAMFENEVQRRKTEGETPVFKFVRLQNAKIEDASLEGKLARIEASFLTEVISALEDKAGAVIAGDEGRIASVKELWTFIRDLGTSGQTWRLADTREHV